MSVKKASKPNLSHSQVTELTARLFGLTVSTIHPLPSYDDQNFHVVCVDAGDFVLKVMNSTDRKMMSLEELDCGYGLQKYLVRLLTYLPGTPMAKITCTPQLLYETGKMGAKLDKILLSMEHENLGALQRENFIWSLSCVPLIDDYLHVMDGDPMQLIIRGVIDQYRNQVVPKFPSFRKCINHGDLNDHNILVKRDGPSCYTIRGILDFGDMSSGYFVFELAITIMYMMIESRDPLEVGGPIIAGFESIFPLNSDERDALYTLVLSRFSQSLVYAHSAVLQQPENEEYLMITTKNGPRLLQLLWEKGKEEVEKVWFEEAISPSIRKHSLYGTTRKRKRALVTLKTSETLCERRYSLFRQCDLIRKGVHAEP
ncbi:hydroxylysine kinase-like [Tachysurus ichikawai]